MSLQIAFDASGVDPRTADAIEDMLAALQTQFNSAVAALGKRVDVPYASAKFSCPASSTAVWTVNPGSYAYFHYAIFGDTIAVTFFILNTAVTNTPDVLMIDALPGIRLAPGIGGYPQLEQPCVVTRDLGVTEAGKVIISNGFAPTTSGPSSTAILAIRQADEGTFPNTGYTGMSGTVIFPFVRI